MTRTGRRLHERALAEPRTQRPVAPGATPGHPGGFARSALGENRVVAQGQKGCTRSPPGPAGPAPFASWPRPLVRGSKTFLTTLRIRGRRCLPSANPRRRRRGRRLGPGALAFAGSLVAHLSRRPSLHYEEAPRNDRPYAHRPRPLPQALRGGSGPGRPATAEASAPPPRGM